jgi:hypothetical protein
MMNGASATVHLNHHDLCTCLSNLEKKNILLFSTIMGSQDDFCTLQAIIMDQLGTLHDYGLNF